MIRNVLNSLRAAVAVGVGIPFLLASSSAIAQNSATAPAPATAPVPNAPVTPEATTDRVIVTGSYIPTAETESALPVTVYTAEVLKKQGANTPAEGLRQLPSFVGNTITENDSNGGNGQAFITLRGLGPANTLTLINGRRAFGFGNINAIPIGALSRSEVLKDGASAIYGSDAVAGVVNFILLNGPGEKPYEGAELFALYGNTTDKDAHVRQVYLRGGVTGLDGKVSIAAAGEYYSRANLYSRDRDIAITADQRNLGGFNNNSPTYPGRVTVSGVARTLINQADNAPNGLASYRNFDPAGSGSDNDRFNFRAFTPAIPAVEKAEYYVTGRYKIFGDGLQLYGDLMYAKTKQDNGLAPSPFTIPLARYANASLGITNGRDANGRLNGSVDNSTAAQRAIIQNSPYNPFGTNITSLSYRFIQELGNRRTFYDQDYFRYVVGVNGDFNIKDNGFISRFGYDSGFLHEDFTQLRIDSGDATRGGLYQQIIAGNFNPFIGGSAPTSGTVPTYVNGVPTGLTRSYDNLAATRAISYLGRTYNYSHDSLADVKMNAHLFPNLWNGGIDLAAGYEYRLSRTQQVPDPTQAQADQLGFNSSRKNKYRTEVNSFFTELGLPLVTSTMNIPFVRSLDLSIAWRYEKFELEDSFFKSKASFDNPNPDEDFGGTPRVSIRYQPIADLTLRASWGQSFLSPSAGQLFAPITQNFPQLFDPYKNAVLQPPNGVFQSGNPVLTPEKTDSYAVGLVYTPKWLPGFTMTMDLYQVYTRDVILSASDFAALALTLNGNFLAANQPNVPLSAAPFADRIERDLSIDAATGRPRGNLLSIASQPQNAGKRLVEGLDITAVYEIPTERWGKFTLSGGYNHFFIWKAEPIEGNGTVSFLGNYNNGTVPLAPGAIPWNKGFLRGEWEWRHFDFVATGNYVGDFRDDPNFFRTIEFRNVPSYITLDMQLSYEFVKPAVEPAPYVKESKDSKNMMQTEAATSSIWQRMLWGTRLTVGVVDAFDRQPPSVIGAFNDNYDTSLYSIRNRYWYVSLNKKF